MDEFCSGENNFPFYLNSRKGTTGKLSPIRDSREYNEMDSYDPYSGVYLGPSEPEVTVVENVNYRCVALYAHTRSNNFSYRFSHLSTIVLSIIKDLL